MPTFHFKDGDKDSLEEYAPRIPEIIERRIEENPNAGPLPVLREFHDLFNRESDRPGSTGDNANRARMILSGVIEHEEK